MNLIWTTDCHLNFLNDKQIKKFCNEILDYEPEGIVITGDISEAPTIEIHMRMLEMYLQKPIFFICGNHDYYKGSIIDTRKMLKEKFNQNSTTKWLGNFPYISLSKNVALVGHDGWYDGRYSDYFKSNLDLHDYHCIKELIGSFYYRVDQYETIGKLAQESAWHITKGIEKAFEKHNTVYVATHVAPFIENSRAPNGEISDKDWLPHFSSKYMGDAILNTMHKYNEEYKLIILCGHNHTFWESNPTNNVRCITGQADYGKPQICGVFQI